MEDVALVKMDSDQSLKLCTFNLCQFFRCNINQRVEDLLKVVVCGLHGLPVAASVLQSLSGCHCPDNLETQQPNLHNIISKIG